jgi:hypothetical protein
MKLYNLFYLSFTSILSMRCAVAAEFLAPFHDASKNAVENAAGFRRPVPLNMDSTDALIRENLGKHLTGCAIPPDSTGHVDIPEDWTSIAEWSFNSCQELKSVTIPASVTTIGDAAFSSCNSLTEITFSPGSALTTIGSSAFSWSGLQSVTIPASVTTIGDAAFSSCNRLTEVTFSPGSALITIGINAFQGSVLSSIIIPATVTTIGDYAFGPWYDKGFLKKVTFSPNSVLTTIGNYAFSNSKLLTVTIPASVTSIGNNAFENCKRLTQITFSPGSSLTTIGDFAFQFTDASSVILPASVTTIGVGAFGETKIFKQKCAIPPDSTGHVVIPTNLTHIADGDFVACNELMSIHIPASVATIGNYAFYHSKRLMHITFAPDSTLTTIGKDAFYSSGLKSMTIPATVTTIDDNAFNDCNRLTKLTFSSGSALTAIGNDSFGKYVQFECLDTEVVTYSVSAFLCRTPCYQANQIRKSDGSCRCVQRSKNEYGECVLCQDGYSTLQGGNQCVAAKTVPIIHEKKCKGYPSIRNLLPENSVSIKYMASSEEKMVIFSGVTKAFFDAVSTVEVRYLISHRKVSVGGTNILDDLSKDQDYYNKRHLLAVPSYTGQTSFQLSFASCADQLIKSGLTGKYISKVRLIFYGVSPKSMLSFDTIAGCKDFYLDQETPFDVNDGVCFDNPELFE